MSSFSVCLERSPRMSAARVSVKSMEQRFSLVTLGVSDLARSRAFYEQGLGWTRANPQDEVAFYQLPGVILALWSRAELAADAGITDTGATFGGIALAINTRSRDEVDDILAAAVTAGGSVLRVAEETPWGGYNGYFADVDGHAWEAAHNPAWHLDEAGQITYADG